MSNFQTLNDAFAELERRADLASAGLTAEPAPPVHRHRLRGVLVAASAAGVLAVAGGVALVARGGGHDGPSGTVAGGAPHPAASTTVAAAPGFRIPQTADELARRFRVVLDGTATFTVTDTGSPVTVNVPAYSPAAGTKAKPRTPVANSAGRPNGAAIVGMLTADGVTGGFDLQIYRAAPGERAWCDDGARCEHRRLADGEQVAVATERLRNSAQGVTYQVNLVRSDGVEFLMHVSNERDPKGDSAVLHARPPLTTDQMVAIVTSARW